VKRWKRLAVYGIVSLTVAGWLALSSLHFMYGTVGPQNPEQEGQNCASCLLALTMASPDMGWAAGDGYFMLRYADGIWDWVRRPTQWAVFSMTAGADGELWATGDDSLHFDGNSWQELSYPSDPGFLTGVSATTPNESWFSGGTIWHYRAGEWTSMVLPDGVSARGIAMLSNTDGWAVGVRYVGDEAANGEILRFQNGVWTEVTTTPEMLSAIAMVSPIEGWAAGEDANGDGVFYHYDGTHWSLFSAVSGASLDNLSVSPTGDIWALGFNGDDTRLLRGEDDTRLYHYSSGAWTAVALPAGIGVRSISSAASDDVWLLGRTVAEEPDGYKHGVILHYHEGQWRSLMIPPRPPANPWTIPLEYATIAYLLLLLFPVAIGFFLFSLRAPVGSAWRKWYSRYIFVWLIAFCLYMVAFFGSSLLNPDLLKGVGENIALAGLLGVLMLPIIIMLVLMLFAGDDMSFRWRRQT
jgi:hypothetical protein